MRGFDVWSAVQGDVEFFYKGACSGPVGIVAWDGVAFPYFHAEMPADPVPVEDAAFREAAVYPAECLGDLDVEWWFLHRGVRTFLGSRMRRGLGRSSMRNHQMWKLSRRPWKPRRGTL